MAGLLPAAFLQVMVVSLETCFTVVFHVCKAYIKSYHSTLKDSVKRFWEEAARRRHEQLQQGSKSYHFAQFAKWLSHDSQLAFG